MPLCALPPMGEAPARNLPDEVHLEQSRRRANAERDVITQGGRRLGRSEDSLEDHIDMLCMIFIVEHVPHLVF